MSFHPRPYQYEWLAAVERVWREKRSALIVAATGTGKTGLFGMVASARLAAGTGRVLVVTHMQGLVRQTAARIMEDTGLDVDIEMGMDRADSGGMFGRAPIVVASLATLTAGIGTWRRMHRFDPKTFGTVIFDEAHHTTSKTWREVWAHFGSGGAKLLGVTATADRFDGKALGLVYDEVAAELDIVTAIEGGWLCPLRVASVHVQGLDYSEIRTTTGDLNGRQLADVLESERMIHRMAGPLVELAGERRTLCACVTVQHAAKMAEVLNRHKPGSADYVHGKMEEDEREAVLGAFARGEIQYLANVGITSEGWDDPAFDGEGVQVLAFCRGTKSRALYAQWVGRILRTLRGVLTPEMNTWEPEERRAAIARSRKPLATVIDFVGNAGRHRLIHAGDLLGGRYDETIRDRAGAMLARSVGEVDPLLVLTEAERREKDEAERRRRNLVVVRAKYTLEEVDPFSMVGIQRPHVEGWQRRIKATERQKALLARWRIPIPAGLLCEEARAIIDEIMSKASEPQAKYLRRSGLDPSLFDRRQASEAITRLRAGESREDIRDWIIGLRNRKATVVAGGRG